MEITPEILKECAKNNRKMQEQLYKHCYINFMTTCQRYYTNSEDARSALNMAFIKIIEHLSKVNLEELKFNSWAKRIIVNHLIDEYRKNKLRWGKVTSHDTDKGLEFNLNATQNDGQENLLENDVMKLLDEIPSASAQVFSLYVIEGYSHQEIAQTMGFTEGTSKWHLSTARKMLRERLEQQEINSEKRYAI